ncbi:MAG: hypothetical protein AAFY81_01015 [Pseudomonadota bacterium]
MSELDPRADIPYRIDFRRSTWPEAFRIMLFGSVIIFAILTGWDWMQERPLDFVEYGLKSVIQAGLMGLVMRFFPLITEDQK